MSVGDQQVGIELTAKDLASREIGKVGESLHEVGQATEETGGHFGVLGRLANGLFNGVMLGAGMQAFGMIQSGFGFAKSAIIDFNAQMEQNRIGFTTMLGSAQKANDFLHQLQTFANNSPFEMQGLAQSATEMMAMGFNAKDVIPTLTAVGDAVSAMGGGAEQVNRVTLALGQMKAHGTVDAGDMLQLTEAGINGWKYIADAMGITEEQARQMSEKGLIPAGKAIDYITSGIEKSNLGGMMKAQATTFNGAMSTIHDALQGVIATAFKPFFDTLSAGALKLATFLQTPEFNTFASNVAAGMTTAFNAIGSFIGGVASVVGRVVTLYRMVQDGTLSLGDAITSVFHTIAAGLPSIDPSKVLNVWLTLGDKVHAAINNALATLLPLLVTAINGLAAALPGILNRLVPIVLEGFRRWATGMMGFISDAVDILMKNLPAIIAAVSNLMQSVFDWLVNTGVPMAANALGPLALQFIDWVFKMLPKLLDALDMVINAIVGFVIKNGPVLAGKLLEWAVAFVGWVVTNVVPRLIENLPTILRAILTFISFAGPVLFTKMGEVGLSMVSHLISFLSRLPGEGGKVLADLLNRVVVWTLSWVYQAKDAAAGFVNGIVSFIRQLPGRVLGFLLDVLVNVGRWELQMLGRAHAAASGFIDGVSNFIRQLPGRVAGFLGDVIGQVVRWAGNMSSQASNTASRFVSNIGSWIMQLPGKIAGFLADVIGAVGRWGGQLLTGASNTARNFVTGFIDGLASLPGRLFDTIRSAFARINFSIGPFHVSGSGITVDLPHISLPGFAVGAWKLPTDMVAQVHKGEMIIPADIAARLRGEVGAPSGNSPASAIASAAMGGGGVVNVVINQHFGPSSVRSADDIAAISRDTAQRVRLLGGAPMRTPLTGSVG